MNGQPSGSMMVPPFLEALRHDLVRLRCHPTVLPKSPLGRAIDYTLGLWTRLGVFVHQGEVEAVLPRHRQIDLEIVKGSDDMKGFKMLPKRWLVERTFSWLIQSRRLIRDHEVRIEHSEALIYLSMTRRMLARIAA